MPALLLLPTPPKPTPRPGWVWVGSASTSSSLASSVSEATRARARAGTCYRPGTLDRSRGRAPARASGLLRDVAVRTSQRRTRRVYRLPWRSSARRACPRTYAAPRARARRRVSHTSSRTILAGARARESERAAGRSVSGDWVPWVARQWQGGQRSVA
ncbi:hypothetical protein DAI22_04g274350 [Oryza sativa Japonica Group]|nr:hypothetical protein DAI22_04g274350 [Oryza sativa Japonica Group]